MQGFGPVGRLAVETGAGQPHRAVAKPVYSQRMIRITRDGNGAGEFGCVGHSHLKQREMLNC